MRKRRWKEMPLISASLACVNIIVFAVCTFTGNLLYNKGGLDILSVLGRGEFGRILWSMFLHGDIDHLVNNMLLVFFLGGMLEKEIGHIRLAAVYFLSGVGGNLLSLAVRCVKIDFASSLGASGAVFGLDGVLLALILFSGRKLSGVSPGRVIIMIAFSLYSGFTATNIDNAAHVGGLIVGFLVGIIFSAEERIRRSAKDE